MAVKSVQYNLGIIKIGDIEPMKNGYVFDERKYDIAMCPSKKVPVSENRMFRMFCHSADESYKIAMRDENGQHMRDEDGSKMYDERGVKSAREFIIIDMSDTKENGFKIEHILGKGLTIIHQDGTKTVYKRVIRTSSQVRVHKAFFTSLDVDMVRERIGFGAKFPEEVIIAQMEARYGLAASSTKRIKNERFTFDIMPDYAIKRTHDLKVWDPKTQELKVLKDVEDEYEPLDGQGTKLPSAAVRSAHRLAIISRKEREFLLDWLEVYNEDFRLAYTENNKEFIRVWEKVPTAWQIRYGFAKGLLVVHPHNLEKHDCNHKKFRTEGKCMEFFEQDGQVDENGRHYYDFSRDIMFTDSMWKHNFNPEYLSGKYDIYDIETREVIIGGPELEIVLWNKPRKNNTVFMGYQYWQAMSKKACVKMFADREIKKLKDTMFTNAEDALAFFSMYDTGNSVDEYEDKIDENAGKIQKAIQLLNENPEMIEERWVQEVIRDTRKKFIEDMAMGRIPVEGANPYIVTCPELQFGRKPRLSKGEYYFNGTKRSYALFRSPLIHKSEAVTVKTVAVKEYEGMYRDILVMNPFDDTLPRMGGADTDGDKVAMVADPDIIKYVEGNKYPMLYDAGEKGKKKPNKKSYIWAYDVTTILASIMSIGEITNMSTSWKDIAQNPEKVKEMFPKQTLAQALELIDRNVCILRFVQGWSIDYAKTGYFPEFPKYTLTQKSPNWKPWSRNAERFGFKGAEVYKSNSQLGQLHTGIKEYMNEKFKQEIKEDTRDFTFEFTDNVDFAEFERIKPLIGEMEQAYRNELRELKNMDLDEEEEKDYITAILEKYRMSVLSIDADIRAIAAAAYVHTYYESSSKSNKISFPWVTVYEGLLLNVSETSTSRVKLRKTQFDGHIDDIPETLKFSKCVSKGDDYEVFAKVPNGTFKVKKDGNRLFVIMPSKSTAKKVVKSLELPKNRHLAFQINSFKYHNADAKKIVELLKANDGIIRIQKVKDSGQKVNSIHAGVWIGGERVANINRHFKHTFLPLLNGTAVELKVVDYDKLTSTYTTKANQERQHKFFNLEAIVSQLVEADMIRPQAEQEELNYITDEGMAYATPTDEDIPAETPTETYIDEDLELDEEEVPSIQFDKSIMQHIDTSADYWNVNVKPEELNIIGASVERIDKVKVGNVCALVTLTASNGKVTRQLTAKIKAYKGYFAIEEVSAKVGDNITALILQVAHYELYKQVVVARKQA